MNKIIPYHFFKAFLWIFLYAIFCLIFSNQAAGQQLDEIGKSDPFKLSGGFSTNQIAYFATGIDNRRDPYNLYLSGNLNLDIYGWSIPVGFNISNQSRGTFQQPFNQYGLTPTYKWITGHIGYSSMSFSSYTLNGQLFNGAGVELAPKGNFKFSAMYGRLQKAVVADSLNLQAAAVEPAYRRIGYGFKAGYYKEKDYLAVVLFKARDQISSNPSVPQTGQITPMDNLATSLSAGKVLFKKVLISGELALSTLTRDQRAGRDSSGNSNGGFLLKRNSSTAAYTAYKTGISYNGGKYMAGIGYERVSPEYRTLGAYYFANDFENITGNFSTRLLKEKLSVTASAGLQHDDLLNQKQSRMQRFVGSANVAYQANQNLSLNASFSNFRSFVNIKSSFNQVNSLTPYDNLDTLNYTQISNNISLNSNYMLRQDKERSQVVTVNLSYMTSADKQGGLVQASGGQFYNFNTTYSINFIPKNFSVSASLNMNRNDVSVIHSSTYGPTLSVSKLLMDKKLRTSLSTSWNSSFANGTNSGNILNARLNGGYTVKKKHQMNLSLVALSKKSPASTIYARQFSEFTTTLGYNYNF